MCSSDLRRSAGFSPAEITTSFIKLSAFLSVILRGPFFGRLFVESVKVCKPTALKVNDLIAVLDVITNRPSMSDRTPFDTSSLGITATKAKISPSLSVIFPANENVVCADIMDVVQSVSIRIKYLFMVVKTVLDE